MNCPKCQTPMRERERETRGELVVIDVCPNCGGFFLDKGELEKLSNAEDRYYAQPSPDRGSERGRDRDDDDDDDDRRRRDDRGYDSRSSDSRGYGSSSSSGYPPRKKRGGFLGELMEGFGGGD